MSVRGMSWAATILILAGIGCFVIGWRINRPELQVGCLLSLVAGAVIFILALRRTAQTIRGFGSVTDVKLREVIRSAEERKKPG